MKVAEFAFNLERICCVRYFERGFLLLDFLLVHESIERKDDAGDDRQRQHDADSNARNLCRVNNA